MFGRNSEAKAEAREVRAQHNARFNNKTTDPDSDEYLASHDKVVAAEQAAKGRG
ncbi:hypothetical protein ACIRF8_15360 [Streptomyces sp. NPDC102406]|uniref:hypothetical protein n=1 Tax=Streptomyces sp. NPDC102406 TaxID=3366171 RepID=UPI0037FC920D